MKTFDNYVISKADVWAILSVSTKNNSLYICLQRATDNLIFGSKHDRKIAIVLGLLMVRKLPESQMPFL